MTVINYSPQHSVLDFMMKIKLFSRTRKPFLNSRARVKKNYFFGYRTKFIRNKKMSGKNKNVNEIIGFINIIVFLNLFQR